MALFYYRKLTGEDGHFPYGTNDDTKERLIRTIFNGSAEITEDLKSIFDQVVANEAVSRKSPYYELANAALGISNRPSYRSTCPRSFWLLQDCFGRGRPPKKRGGWHSDYRSDIDMETHFGLASKHHEYYPASAFQTPMFGLLRVAPKDAVDFILEFTNKAVEYFAQTELGKPEVEEIEIHFDAHTTVKQYVCHRIWNSIAERRLRPIF